jgi:iron complex transport system substrate-binding protein
MKKRNTTALTGYLACFMVSLLLCSSCRQVTKPIRPQSAKTGSAEISYAKGFTIEYYDTYKLLSIYTGTAGIRDTIQYVLLAKGVKAPEGYEKAQLIQIPVKSLVGMSSMHVALADFAGSPDIITGLGSLQYVSSAAVRKNIKAGKVKEVGIDGNMNEEVLISMNPGLVMVMGNPESKFNKYQTLTAAGVPVMLNSEWLETTPLGRAEWVKVMAALLNKEKLVNKKFDSIVKEYNRLADLGRKVSVRPTVITGMPFKGTWYVPDGDSYMVQFLKDAGTNYNWSNIHGTGSLPLNFETVAPVALKADVWLNPGYVNSRKDIKSLDARYADFKPFKTNRIFNYNKRQTPEGSNDYWESGAVNPHLVLADLIKVLHPELLPAHTLVYYRQLN